MIAPAKWRIAELTELASVLAVRSASSSGTGAVRCVELEHVEANTGRLIGWREGNYELTSKVGFEAGDVLFGKLRPYLRKAWHATFSGICTSEFWVLRALEDNCDKGFLHQLALSSRFAAATHASSGSKMPRADWSFVSEYPFLLPPLSEQHVIGRILKSWDQAIDKMVLLLGEKAKRKRGLTQQLLEGKMRFKEFQGELWRSMVLGDVVTHEPRITTKPKNVFLAAGIRSHGKGVFLKPDFEAEDIALDELFQLRTDDLVVNITFGWEGAVAIVPPVADGALVSHRFPTFTFKPGVSFPGYFRHVIRQKRFVHEMGLASPGGAGRNRVLSKTDFLRIPIKLPSFEEQQRIAEVLNACDREIELLEKQLETLKEQKRGLMQKLLTGEIRVKVGDGRQKSEGRGQREEPRNGTKGAK